MTRHAKLIRSILSSKTDATIRFDRLRSLLLRLGFQERIRGSHHIFHRHDVAEILNLQPRADGTAKPYQVRQVRDVLLRYGWRERNDD